MLFSQDNVGFAACEWKVIGPVGAERLPVEGSVLPELEGRRFGGPGRAELARWLFSVSSSALVKLAIFRCEGRVNWLRISRLRRPSMGVSTVKKTAL